MAKLSDENDVLCVATLSHFDYLPFCLVGLNKQMEASLITGKFQNAQVLHP